ncbi:lytic transglycosylase domain-containing protein [Sphingomonas sp.]|uniref:lytic transglycosylase domain-containing protein n=1 Tax=Sphingomonas sp. TaxID=28214 RepID=UPI0025F5D5E4|nr:lytic transglycosylase domain-containing protein [Sphingomonas sp.]
MKFGLALATVLLAASGISGVAQASTASTANVVLPVQLGPNARAQYQEIFAAIDAQAWSDAGLKLDAMPAGPLHPVARALIYLGKGSPRIEGPALSALATQAPELPQSVALVRLASSRGADAVPALPEVRQLYWLGTAPRRSRVSATTGDPQAAWLAAQILPLIKEDRPIEAEALLVMNEDKLSPAAVTEWRQRVAWSYFLTGDDKNARALATRASAGTGDWAAQGQWVAGLAAWRQKDFTGASDAFSAQTRMSSDPEMVAAGHYWAARADMAAHQPDRVQPHLRAAARLDETFYGLLAQAAMGLARAKDDDGSATIRAVADHPNIRAALALAEIGQLDRADELIRWQARIGVPIEHATLTLIAGKLNLPATQLWLAHNGPTGARTTAEGRYPAPNSWVPQGGWRVDKSLVFAHALQESNFRVNATSAAGARGLMQVMPATAQIMARNKGETVMGSLASPSVNMEYGQTYIEKLRDMSVTGGLLPKVIAAYNCGPGPLDRWNARGEALNRDPLLYIESISYWETRGYVTTVMRNYWMYQQQAGKKTASRDALVQGLWPKFPGAVQVASAERAGH